MSQKKVDYYKEQKANRQQIMKQEKRKRRIEITALTAVFAALVIWFAAAVVHNVKVNNAGDVQATQVSTAVLDDYLSDLSSKVNGTDEADEEDADSDADSDAEEVEVVSESETE